jgi:hypothetical protein
MQHVQLCPHGPSAWLTPYCSACSSAPLHSLPSTHAHATTTTCTAYLSTATMPTTGLIHSPHSASVSPHTACQLYTSTRAALLGLLLTLTHAPRTANYTNIADHHSSPLQLLTRPSALNTTTTPCHTCPHNAKHTQHFYLYQLQLYCYSCPHSAHYGHRHHHRIPPHTTQLPYSRSTASRSDTTLNTHHWTDTLTRPHTHNTTANTPCLTQLHLHTHMLCCSSQLLTRAALLCLA